MNPQEQSELEALCKKIAVESDHEKFMVLVVELNKLLERKERRLERPAEPTFPQT